MKLPTTVATAALAACLRNHFGASPLGCVHSISSRHGSRFLTLAIWEPRSMNKRALTIYLMLWMFGSTALFADPGTDYGPWSTVPGMAWLELPREAEFIVSRRPNFHLVGSI